MVREPLRGYESSVGDAAVVAATGRSREDWFALLDGAGAVLWPHGRTARWLVDEHGWLTDPERISRWLDVAPTVRGVTPPESLRWAWPGELAPLKQYWTDRLGALVDVATGGARA